MLIPVSFTSKIKTKNALKLSIYHFFDEFHVENFLFNLNLMQL